MPTHIAVMLTLLRDLQFEYLHLEGNLLRSQQPLLNLTPESVSCSPVRPRHRQDSACLIRLCDVLMRRFLCLKVLQARQIMLRRGDSSRAASFSGASRANRLNVPKSRLSDPSWCFYRGRGGRMITSKPHFGQTREPNCQVLSLEAPHPDFMAYLQKPFVFPHYQFLSFALLYYCLLSGSFKSLAGLRLW